MGRGENNLLYGDAFEDVIDAGSFGSSDYQLITDPTSLRYNPDTGDSIERWLERKGLDPDVSSIDYESILLNKKPSPFNYISALFEGKSNQTDSNKTPSSDNSFLYNDYSGNYRIFFKKNSIPDWLCNERTKEKVGPATEMPTKELLYNLIKAFNKKTLKGVSIHDVDFVDLKKLEENTAESGNPRGEPVLVQSMAKDGLAFWYNSGELMMTEKMFGVGGSWKNVQVDDTDKIKNHQDILTYMVDGSPMVFIMGASDSDELNYL